MKYTILFLVAALSMSGCIGIAIAESGKRASVLNAARFDYGCKSMKIVDKGYPDRYAIQGCGKRVVYQCKSVPGSMGRPAYEADCQQVRGNR